MCCKYLTLLSKTGIGQELEPPVECEDNNLEKGKCVVVHQIICDLNTAG